VEQDGHRAAGARYRRDYLKLRSALYDRTTGLPAFPVLFDRLRTMLDQRRRIGVLHLEVANLGQVESLYGWQVFDRILSRVARELSGAVGAELPGGTLVGVSGVAGDRFAAFVAERPDGEEVDAAFLGRLARALAQRLDGAFGGAEFAGLSPALGIRTGHALLSINPFYRFERRIYAALEEARAYEERREQRRELSWADELQQIIRDADVGMLFQPVVDLRSRAVLGHEAFARGPKDSPLEMPRALFALSDRCGVAADLDRICREAALRAATEVADCGKLFLNVLPSGLDELRQAEHGLPELLETLALSPGDLVLEFSERFADGEADAFCEGLSRLKELGFGVALDDVGTGYGSQAVLDQARPDYLKLDLSLVRNIHEHLIKQELLHSLVRIAERIGASVIAEGIESEEEAATLAEAGARYGQGFLFAEPAPAAALLGGGRAGEH
jgi:EAL domain-containing protein (putative c-di-GMP-specific phosphodiesterase class I)/GGDEF domain-containing protein